MTHLLDVNFAVVLGSRIPVDRPLRESWSVRAAARIPRSLLTTGDVDAVIRFVGS